MKSVKRTVRAMLWSLGWLYRRSDYPQTWYIWPNRHRWPRLRRWIEWWCGVLVGHEHSKTEWGYGGGGMIDRNCRWCDKLIQVPMNETTVPDALKDLGGLVDETFKPME